MVKRPMWVKVRMILLQPMPRERKWLEDLCLAEDAEKKVIGKL